MEIILASKSPRREKLLRSIVGDFKIIPSQTTELFDNAIAPFELAMKNAMIKARDVSLKNPDAIVIGADTIVVLEGKILGKPKDLEQAIEMLEMLSGKTHEVITGIAIIHQKKELHDFITSTVSFKELARKDIENYVNEKQPLDKAGAYGIQEVGERFIDDLIGSFENVMGFPIEIVADMLREFESIQ